MDAEELRKYEEWWWSLTEQERKWYRQRFLERVEHDPEFKDQAIMLVRSTVRQA